MPMCENERIMVLLLHDASVCDCACLECVCATHALSISLQIPIRNDSVKDNQNDIESRETAIFM